MEHKKLLFILTDISFFFSHRQWLAKDAQARGFEIHVACPNADKNDALKALGFFGHHMAINAGGMNPFKDYKTTSSIKKLVHKIKPDIVQSIGLKCNLPTALACRRIRDVHAVFLFTGLGFLFTNQSKKIRGIRYALKPLFKYIFSNKNAVSVFQNPDDLAELVDHGFIPRARTQIIEGSGVVLDEYPKTPQPHNAPIKILMPARLVGDKGVREYIKAARLVKETDPSIVFQVAGDRAPHNPTCLSATEIKRASDVVTFLGHQSDMVDLYKQADIVCLPSYREGLPRALLEAASIGRPLIATDVPGCRQIVEHEKNGLRVPAREFSGLVEAIIKLAGDADLRARYGETSRQMMEARFSMAIVNQKMLGLYETLTKT